MRARAVRNTMPIGAETASATAAVLEHEHPSLLHVARGLMGVFDTDLKLVARVYLHRVEIVRVG